MEVKVLEWATARYLDSDAVSLKQHIELTMFTGRPSDLCLISTGCKSDMSAVEGKVLRL